MDEFWDCFVEKYKVEVPHLREDEIEASQQDQQYDARRGPNRVTFDDSCPVWIPGRAVHIPCPCDGERDPFAIRASTFTDVSSWCTFAEFAWEGRPCRAFC
jgi:hypothetical protein